MIARHRRPSLAALALLPLLSPGAASAHIVFSEPRAQAGAYHAGFLRLSHGCGDSATRAISVRIPRGVDVARPQPKPGWKLTIQRQKLAKPIRTEAGLQTERVTAIVWEGHLPADQFDQFGVMMKLPARAGPLYFPVRQTCVKGARDWAQIPQRGAAWNSVESPAPVLMLTPAASSKAHDH